MNPGIASRPLAAVLTFAFAFMLTPGEGGKAVAADREPLAFDIDARAFSARTVTVDGRAVRYRAYEGIVYVARPVNAANQSMNIYVPAEYFEGKSVGAWDARTAPILLQNEVGGYMPASPGRLGGDGLMSAALARGMVVASPGARGSTSRGARGENTGKAPAAIVDLKAAVRYLRHNDRAMPGDAERIVSNGTSAGGALSALLGATGNAPSYMPYLKAIGAADARDDIFAASCYCPITDLDHADMAYEWQFNGLNDFQSWDGKGTLTPDQVRLSARLKARFPDYLNRLGLKGPDGTPLRLDGHGEGSFKDHVKSFVIASAQEALDAGKDLSGLDWIMIRDGKVAGLDFERYVAHATRMKSTPAFDSPGLRTPENLLFGDVRTDRKHFTALGRETAPADPAADPAVVTMMNPMDSLAAGGATTARFWRIRHGAADRDTSLAVPVILATMLRNRGLAVDFALPWARGHGGDYDPDEFLAWVDHACRPGR